MCSGSTVSTRTALSTTGAGIDLGEAIDRVLRLPAVADKSFLITIGDRSHRAGRARPDGRALAGAGGRRAGDPHDYHGFTGEAMAMGERTPLALLNAPASGRMAVGGGHHQHRRRRHRTTSATSNCPPTGWRRPGHPGEDARLYDTVKAVGMELCPGAGHRHSGRQGLHVHENRLDRRPGRTPRDDRAAVADRLRLRAGRGCAQTLTPQLRTDRGDTDLILIDLGAAKPAGRLLSGAG
jgi:phosphoribosylformylglycinamidine synthase